MYMRLVQMKVNPERISEMREFYDQKVIPALKSTNGCLFASLMRSEEHSGEGVSMTLWDNQANAEAYGSSELYRNLIEEIKTFLADSAEWKVQLSKDLTLEYVPVVEEPLVKSYSVGAFKEGAASPADRSQSMYVRIVAPKVRPGRLEDFERIYTTEVIPALRSVKGCRYAYLTEGWTNDVELFSVTVWDSQQDVENYERSGLFNSLSDKLKDTYSESYQWKMQLDKDSGKKVVMSEDAAVEHYRVVTGVRFGGQ